MYNYKQSKRRIVSKNECEKDLNKVLPRLFEAFHSAHSNFEREIRQTPPSARARAFEACLLNSKMIQAIQNYFPSWEWKFGKYKRFILQTNGYIILFKKLNKNGMPMNIATKHANAISNQLTYSLFDDQTMIYEPILFFGYRKDALGNIINPQLTYIDESRIKWTIEESNTTINIDKIINLQVSSADVSATPKLKLKQKRKIE